MHAANVCCISMYFGFVRVVCIYCGFGVAVCDKNDMSNSSLDTIFLFLPQYYNRQSVSL